MATIGAMMQQGAALHRQGQFGEARRHYEKVLAREPNLFDAVHLSGLTWLQEGNPEKAEPLLRRAVALKPDLADAHINLGKALGVLNQLDEAMACCREALRLKPGHPRALDDLQRWKMFAAEKVAEAALARDDLAAAAPAVATVVKIGPNLRNRSLSFRLAMAHLRRGDYAAASEALLAPVWQLHDPDGGLPPAIEPFTTTSPAKLRHDIEQFRHLRAKGVLDESYDKVIADFGEVLAALPGGEVVHTLSDAERRKLGWQHNRLLHLAPAPPMSGGVLNPALDGAALEKSFHETPPGIVFFDDFLRPAAMTALYDFCQDSTIWWQLAFANELGTSIRNGFACPLLLQMAEELRQLVPGLLADLEIRTIWAYKYYKSDSGLAMHVDDGAVSLNFWLTPDAANLDPDTGGLTFWDHTQAPVGYFDTSDPDEKLRLLHEALAATPNARAHRLPYRQNRAALFNSKVLHQTDEMHFRDGYDNRRINMTMIFGELRR